MKFTEFCRIFEDTLELEPGSVKGDEALADLKNWDSLAPLSLIAMADQRFGVTLSANAIRECRTVRDLAGLFGGNVTE